jgi:peptide/nickel transport system substrate-binding protein
MSAAKRLATLGCVGLLATTSACASAKSTGSVDGAPSSKITMGTIESYSELDPAGAYDYGSWLVFYNVYQGLMSYQAGATEPTPDAAQSCNFVGTNFETYTCTLRPGLKFSNGDPLNAAAVVYSFNRVVKIGQLSANWKGKTPPPDNGSGVSSLLSTMKSVTANGNLGVTFTLNTPDVTFPDKLASGVGGIVDPAVYPATSLLPGTGVVGSGVYKIDSVAFGTGANSSIPQSVTMSLNPNYQGSAISSTDTPQNSSVTLDYFYAQGSKSAAQGVMDALNNDTIDLNADNDLPPGDEAALESNQQLGKGLQVNDGAGTQSRMIVLNTKNGPFSDVKLRQAVARLINREQIVNDVYSRTVVPLYSLIPQGIGDASTAFQNVYPEAPQSPAAVKSWLLGVDKDVHLPVSFKYYYTSDSAAGTEEADMIKKQLDAGGIFNVELAPIASLKILGPMWNQGTIPASVSGWSPDYPDPDDLVAPFVSTPGQGGTFGSYYTNSDIINTWLPETLTQQQRSSQEAETTFAKIQKQMAEDAAFIPLWQDKQYVVTQPDITGVPLTLDTAGIMRFWMVGKS